MFGNKKRKGYLAKIKKYLREWDTVEYGYVQVLTSGALIQTNNYTKEIICMNKAQFAIFIMVLEANT